MKFLFNIAGSIALLLGVIGIVVPLLPTTPFLLLASACFLRGSPRLHRWLLNAPVLGKYLYDYQQHRVVPLQAKVLAMVVLWPSLLWSMYLVQSLILRIVLFLIGAGVTCFLWRLPSRAKNPATD